MPTLTVYISGKGTPYARGGTSSYGHMWFSIQKDGAPEKSFGWASQNGTPFGRGRVTIDDTENYTKKIYEKSVYISEKDYVKLNSFGNNPSGEGFTPQYDFLENSCVDFTY